MKHKHLITTKLDQINNNLTSLDSLLSSGRSPRELKEYIEKMKEKLADVQTLINNESESWN
jgi:hypothetical protein